MKKNTPHKYNQTDDTKIDRIIFMYYIQSDI